MESNQGENAREVLNEIDSVGSPYQIVAPMERWYHVLFGAGIALMVFGQGLSAPWSAVVGMASILGFILLMSWWSRAQGWWVSGYASPKARWAAILSGALAGACAFGSFLGDSLVLSGMLAVVAGLGGAGLSALWMRIWRREIAAPHA